MTWFAETQVLVRAFPFHNTVDCGRFLLPLTVKINAGADRRRSRRGVGGPVRGALLFMAQHDRIAGIETVMDPARLADLNVTSG